MENIAPSGRQFFQLKPFFLVETIPFQWQSFLVVEAIPFGGNHSFYWKPSILMETIAPSGRHSFQLKPFPLVEAVRFIVKCFLSFQWKPFLQRKSLTFSGKNFFQWKLLFFDRWHFLYRELFLLLESIHFSRRCSQKKPLPAVETNFFRRSLFFLVEALWKLLLLKVQ